MSIVARLFGSNLSLSLRGTTLPSIKSIATIFKAKSLYTLPWLLISRATLSTTLKPDGDVPVAPYLDGNNGGFTESVKSSALIGPSTSLKPMERDERIAYLEKSIIQTKLELSEVVKNIEELSAKRDSLLDKFEQLTNIEERRLKTIEEQNLPYLRKYKYRLAEKLSDNRKELKELRTISPTQRLEKGMCNPILSYPILSYPVLSYPILSYPVLSYFIPSLTNLSFLGLLEAEKWVVYSII